MTEPNRQSGENEERIIEIEIERLRPFKEHPFQVKDDKEMFLLQESIEKYGILNPLIVRPVPDGYYEIISGHRRKHAAEKLGYRKVPVIIRVLSEDDSILSMVDSNLHRERISYSEKAFAYKLKNDVLKRKSGRKKSQVDHKTPRKRAIEIISEDCGDSPKQVQRYISLTKLIPEMLQKLDDEIISFCPAVKEMINADTTISVYDHGYVLYTAGNQSTVFPLHSCDDYEYVSVTGDNKEFNKEFFDNENWYIRLLMEAEDRMAYSQSKISTNHGVFSNSDVTDDAEIMRGSSKDFVDDVIDREILNALIKELTERQKTVLNLVYFEEMRQQDVADYLGIKQQSVNDLLNRALKTMKKKAENEEF